MAKNNPILDIESKVQLLSGVKLFKGLNQSELNQIASGCKVLDLPTESGYDIFSKGHSESDMYVVISGLIKLHDDGHIFERLKNGDYFGEYALLDDAPRSLTATAENAAHLLVIPKAVVDPVLNLHPEILRQLVKEFVSRLRRQNSIEHQLVTSNQQISQEKQVIETEKIAVENEKDRVQKHNHRIMESMEYAKYVQESILSGKDFRRAQFSFIRAQKAAKEQVSGDFYWHTKTDSIDLVALVDCTGHGAPGALMSILGHHLITKAVSEEGLSQPGQILQRMHGMLLDNWNASGHGISDGMDMGMLAIDQSTSQCQYAGAHISCFVLHKERKELDDKLVKVVTSDDHEQQLVEYKGTAFSLGDKQRLPAFKVHEFKLEPGDRLFMVTDGYTDQIHQHSRKRILKKTLKELLLKWHDLPIEKQLDELSDYFHIWKGDAEQIDDATIVAIEI